MEPNHLTTLAAALSAHTKRAEATISNKAAGNAVLFARLRRGEGCTLKTAKRVLGWFDENWPADLAWPENVPRPSKDQRAA